MRRRRAMSNKENEIEIRKICKLNTSINWKSTNLVLIGCRNGTIYMVTRNRKKDQPDYSLYVAVESK
jgi:hypothetical protein